MIKKAHKELTILKTKITITPKSELLGFISNSLKKNVQLFVTTPNPEIILKAHSNNSYRKVINESDIAVPDAVGVCWAIRLLHQKSIKRIPGRELFLDLLNIANEKSLHIYLLGASKDVNDTALAKIHTDYPQINVKGSSDIKINSKSPFDIKNYRKQYSEIVKDINDHKTDMLFVFLGAPAQELWFYAQKKHLKVKLAATLGGSLDYYVGRQVIPPNLISRLGLEWLWRLVFQPTRIKRIVNAVVLFPLLVLKEKYLSNN